MNIYDSSEYKLSRKAYIGQATFEYLISLLVSDVYLATLLSNIGISDSVIGIISSFITFAFLFQLLSIIMVSKVRNVKRTVIFFDCLSQFLFMALYAIPFLKVSFALKTTLAILFILCAYIFKYLVSGMLFKWANSFVENTKRAQYSAGKEIVSLVSGILFTLVVGFVIDKFTELNNIEGGFIFIAAAMLILNICNFVGLKLIKKDSVAMLEDKKSETTVTFSEAMRNTLGNRNFVNVVIMTAMVEISRYMTFGFLGTFKVKDLLISVGTVQVINMMGNLARILLSKPFGRLSDRTSYAAGMRYALVLLAGSFLINVFTVRSTWWFIIIHTILYNVSMAGTNGNSFNIIYSYVDVKYFVQATAIKNSIGGICGFLTTLIASKILGAIQANGNSFLGIKMYGQQLLSLISFMLVCITILYTYFVVERQEVKRQ